MENSFTNQFFEGTETMSGPVSEKVYAEARQNIEQWETMSGLIHQSLYVIDLHKRNFFYVSPSPLFWGGHSPSEVKEQGYGIYARIVHPDDLLLLIHIHKAVLDCFNSQLAALGGLGFVTFNFRILYNTIPLMVNYKVKPMALAADGSIWLAGCLVSLSAQKNSGNLYLYLNDEPIRYKYSFESGLWKKQPKPELTKREKEILLLSAQGHANKDIAKGLKLSESTVKNQKNTIYKKLDTSTIGESVTKAINYRLI